MLVLLTGASGFIGSHLADALLGAGHQVICAVREPARHADSRLRYVAADFTRDLAPADWLPRLADIDVVINAAGIVRERGAQTFDAIHSGAPRALFAACSQSGVRLVIQISALGADRDARSRFHLSKKAADDFLAALPVASVIVQPSLVYGPGGTSARLFTTMAGLPLIGLPGDGMQMIQPVHIDDAVTAIVARVALVGHTPAGAQTVPLVGPAPLSFKNFLSSLRHAMGIGAARFVPVPLALVRFAARLGRMIPGSLLEPETLRMLERGNCASAAVITGLLGHAPRSVDNFIAPSERPMVRMQARLNWLLPLLRWSIATVWIATGIVSLGLYPVADSYALLARVGVPPALAPAMLYGAALLDLVFGVATLTLKRRRRLWLAQIAVILFYSVIISVKLPEFWLHPYGPLLKNLPMLAAIWLLLELEDEQV